MPTGAGIDPQTGLFTWATSAGDAGTYAITVRVTDDGTPVLFRTDIHRDGPFQRGVVPGARRFAGRNILEPSIRSVRQWAVIVG